MHGAALLVAALFAQGADTTPDGPATLFSDWHGPVTLEGRAAVLLTGYKVTVAPGGRAGTVRLRVFDRSAGVVHDAAPVTLPAEPGTYTFPAPHILHDYRDVSFGLDQEVGGHAITGQMRCGSGSFDVCDAQSVDVYRPIVATGARPDRRTAEVLRGRVLTIDPVTEPDLDADLAGDLTEDRTNLRASVAAERRGRRLTLEITVENAGPRPADRPRLSVGLFPPVGLGRWERPCRRESFFDREDNRDQTCLLAPLAVGESRTLRLAVPDPGRAEVDARVEAEGPDLVDGDEFTGTRLRGTRPPLALEVEPHPRIDRRLRVTVRSARAGVVRLRVSSGSRTLRERSVRFRRPGTRELRLRVHPSGLTPVEGLKLTLTARSQTTSVRAEVQASY